MGRQPSDQPYHIILAGSPYVGKTSVFTFLSGHEGGLYESAMDSEGQPVIQSTSPSLRSDLVKGGWHHSVTLEDDTVQVSKRGLYKY